MLSSSSFNPGWKLQCSVCTYARLLFSFLYLLCHNLISSLHEPENPPVSTLALPLRSLADQYPLWLCPHGYQQTSVHYGLAPVGISRPKSCKLVHWPHGHQQTNVHFGIDSTRHQQTNVCFGIDIFGHRQISVHFGIASRSSADVRR